MQVPAVEIRKDAKIGIICRGGPVNGPYSAAVLRVLLEGLSGLGLKVANLYGNSASVPSVETAALGHAELACDAWADLTPSRIIVRHNQRWVNKVLTIRNLLFSESVFDDSPLEKLIRDLIPLSKMFAPEAIPTKIMTVDYLTGLKMVGSNKNPKHRPNWYPLTMGSMSLIPFLKPQVITDVVESEVLMRPYRRTGILADVAVAMDGGYRDNMMFDCACRDGNDVVFMVDINGLEFGPLETWRWEHWAHPLERSMHLLTTTNDRRRLTGVTRTNEILAVRDEIRELAAKAGDKAKKKLLALADRMDNGWLTLHNKHKVQVIKVEDPGCSRPFNFAEFTKGETMHLLHCGEKSAHRVMDHMKVVA